MPDVCTAEKLLAYLRMLPRNAQDLGVASADGADDLLTFKDVLEKTFNDNPDWLDDVMLFQEMLSRLTNVGLIIIGPRKGKDIDIPVDAPVYVVAEDDERPVRDIALHLLRRGCWYALEYGRLGADLQSVVDDMLADRVLEFYMNGDGRRKVRRRRAAIEDQIVSGGVAA